MLHLGARTPLVAHLVSHSDVLLLHKTFIPLQTSAEDVKCAWFVMICAISLSRAELMCHLMIVDDASPSLL